MHGNADTFLNQLNILETKRWELFIYLFICLFICLFLCIYLFVYIFMYLFIYHWRRAKLSHIEER